MKNSNNTTLAELPVGRAARIEGLLGDTVSKRRLMALGLVKGKEISLETKAPMGDPKIYSILGYRLSIRNDDAKNVLVSTG
ncbi:MAG: ferrous iron transport protein A [Magnetococcales bacterium]|nr:ferrous iron transport protein A [Magnetococcales bacterium]